MALVVKNSSGRAGKVRDGGSIPGSGRSPEGGRGNPLQDSCLENLMDRGVLQATVHGVTKSWTWLKQLSKHACMPLKWTAWWLTRHSMGNWQDWEEIQTWSKKWQIYMPKVVERLNRMKVESRKLSHKMTSWEISSNAQKHCSLSLT